MTTLWPEHELPVQALFACDTQWRVAGTLSGVVFLGLDYGACDVSLKAHDLTMTSQAWRDFRVLEGAATALRNGTKPEALLAGEQLQ